MHPEPELLRGLRLRERHHLDRLHCIQPGLQAFTQPDPVNPCRILDQVTISTPRGDQAPEPVQRLAQPDRHIVVRSSGQVSLLDRLHHRRCTHTNDGRADH